MHDLFLIVGLGNPGAEYARTRHNAGFMVVERLARRWEAPWRLEARFQAALAWADCEGRRCLLCRPQTYMNASGEAVGAVLRYYQAPVTQLLAAVDDADLPLGSLRLRPEGSSGGHHGLESLEQHLGTRQYARLRLGIGRRAEDGRRITSHVLGRFNAEEAALFEKVLERAADAAACWLSAGALVAMNRYNGTIEVPETKDS